MSRKYPKDGPRLRLTTWNELSDSDKKSAKSGGKSIGTPMIGSPNDIHSLTPEEFAEIHIAIARNSIEHGYSLEDYVDGITKLAEQAYIIAKLDDEKGSSALPN